MKLSLGFSPCPNDTFIFDAMVHGKVDTEGLDFDYFMTDVEELNRKALRSEVDITKISFHAYVYTADNYIILDSGSALGYGNGPLLISKYPLKNSEIDYKSVAIPGKLTTANLLFSIAWPGVIDKREYLFSDIVDAVAREEVDTGLIIHETRFTFHKHGLLKIADMGEYWNALTGLPIPLGTIVIRRDIPVDVAESVNRVLRRSIEYAIGLDEPPSDFVAGNAREMEGEVMKKHIELYVNEFTLSLGRTGREAVRRLYEYASGRGVIPGIAGSLFLIND